MTVHHYIYVGIRNCIHGRATPVSYVQYLNCSVLVSLQVHFMYQYTQARVWLHLPLLILRRIIVNTAVAIFRGQEISRVSHIWRDGKPACFRPRVQSARRIWARKPHPLIMTWQRPLVLLFNSIVATIIRKPLCYFRPLPSKCFGQNRT